MTVFDVLRLREHKMAKANTKVLTAHVPVPLAEKVDQLANRLERSRGWVIKQALSAWIEQEYEIRYAIQESTIPDSGYSNKIGGL